MLAWLAFLGSMFILFAIGVINPPPPTVPQPGGIIDIRGNRLAILRMVTAQPFEGIEVFDDGTAIRFYYPGGAPHDYSQITLTPDEQTAFVQFRMQWCQQMPSFRALAATEAFYDLGVRCGGYDVKQAKVPPEQLPAIFVQLQQRLPRPKK
jgi:hypothetical protein